MSDELPGVKHIKMTCMNGLQADLDKRCKAQAFVQVVIVGDDETQKKIDHKANIKLREALDHEHEEGLHDGR